MALSIARRAARTAVVPVYVVAGSGSRAAAQGLRLDGRIRVVESPRHAMVLVIVGSIDADLRESLERLHDALPQPRATLWWNHAEGTAPPIRALAVPGGAHEIVAACVARGHDLITGTASSEVALLPDVARHAWRGVGPYKQGGTGMTGGTPYGRPLAGRADDLRDRLTLDIVPLTVGPFFASLPDDFILKVTFQGDIVHELQVIRAPAPPARHDGVFWKAATQPVTVRAMELERAASHLRWLAEGLRLVGLPGVAERALRLSVQPDLTGVNRLVTMVERLVAPVTRGVGRLQADLVRDRGLGGTARASGLAEDVRVDDPVYASLGFNAVVMHGGDVWARWRQRLHETVQSLELAERAGNAVTGGEGRPVEGPHGEVGVEHLATLLNLLPTCLQGNEWGDAVMTIHSLDVNADLEPARPAVPA